MNYYMFNVGDYAAATQHLNELEDLAYRRLMDLYYGREEPIPLDMNKTYRLVRASSPGLKKAVTAVLAEFFTKDEDGYRNHRCDEEIAIAGEKSIASNDKKGNEKERQRRHRQRRGELFEMLRQSGSVPPYDTPTKTLEDMVRQRTSHTPVTRDIAMSVHQTQRLPNPNPNPNPNISVRDRDRQGEDLLHDTLMTAMDGKAGSSPRLFDTSPIHRLIAEGISLETVILPKVRALAASAKQPWSSWEYVAKIIRSDLTATAPPDPQAPIDVDLWSERIATARRLTAWDAKWGPMPGTPGCRAPKTLLQPADGDGWTIWKPDVA